MLGGVYECVVCVYEFPLSHSCQILFYFKFNQMKYTWFWFMSWISGTHDSGLLCYKLGWTTAYSERPHGHLLKKTHADYVFDPDDGQIQLKWTLLCLYKTDWSFFSLVYLCV